MFDEPRPWHLRRPSHAQDNSTWYHGWDDSGGFSPQPFASLSRNFVPSRRQTAPRWYSVRTLIRYGSQLAIFLSGFGIFAFGCHESGSREEAVGAASDLAL